MASLNDLYDAFQNQTFENLRRKIEVALLIKAQATLANVSAPEARVTWARNALVNIENESRFIMNYLIGLNNTQSINNLANDTDATVKTNVNTTIDTLYPAD